MSWMTDLASGLGIPAGAATLAVAMYAACAAAEKAARPEALNDIGHILKDPSWSRSLSPSAIVERVFIWTFGERHLSWKCVHRSATATLLFAIIAGFVFNSAVTDTITGFRKEADSTAAGIGVAIGAFATLFFFGLLPDYIALWKTRVLMGLMHRRRLGPIITPVLDLVLSFAVGYFCATLLWAFLSVALSATGTYMDVTKDGVSFGYDPNGPFLALLRRSNSLNNWYEILALGLRGTLPVLTGHVSTLRGVLFLSTLFTSIWTILILLSTTLIKLLAPIQHFTIWFFDAERHPVQSIGVVSGGLVMVGALIGSVLQAVI